MQEENTSVV